MSGNADKPCLVLFSGGVETQEFFALELAKAWDEMGYTIFFYNLMREEESYNGLEHFVQDMQTENRRMQEKSICIAMTEVFFGRKRVFYV